MDLRVRRTMQNHVGMVRVLRATLPLLRKQGSAHILGVSSGLGILCCSIRT